MTFIKFHKYNTQYVMDISKFQFQIYKTSRFIVKPIFRRDSLVLIFGRWGFIFHFRQPHKDWLGRWGFEKGDSK